jgi:putative hydrolase of the HAD superfamily
MYGVIMKDPEGGFAPFVNRTFPELTHEEIYKHWNKGNLGEITSLELFRNLGYIGDMNAVEKEYLETIEIDQAFYIFVKGIKKHCKLGLISNDLAEWNVFLRSKYRLNEYFDVITVSGDVKMKKPDELIFTTTLDGLGLDASECTYVDDRRNNLVAAKALGMDTVLFNTRKVEYDGKTVNNFEELLKMLMS